MVVRVRVQSEERPGQRRQVEEVVGRRRPEDGNGKDATRPGNDVPGGAPVERAGHARQQPLDRGQQQPHVPAQEPGEMRPLLLVRQARGADPRVSQDRLVRTAYPGGVDTRRCDRRPEGGHRRTACRGAGVWVSMSTTVTPVRVAAT